MATQKLEITTTPKALAVSLSLDATKAYSLQNRGPVPIFLYQGAAAPAAPATAPAFVLLPAPEIREYSATSAGFLEWTKETNEDLFIWTEQGVATLVVGLA